MIAPFPFKGIVVAALNWNWYINSRFKWTMDFLKIKKLNTNYIRLINEKKRQMRKNCSFALVYIHNWGVHWLRRSTCLWNGFIINSLLVLPPPLMAVFAKRVQKLTKWLLMERFFLFFLAEFSWIWGENICSDERSKWHTWKKWKASKNTIEYILLLVSET